MPNKHEITAAIIAQLESPRDLDVDVAQRLWFRNLWRHGGMRLTQQGFHDLQQAGLRSWTVPVDWREMPRRVLLQLDQGLAWPYFIDVPQRRLVLFGAREAMLATLYGDLRSFLDRVGRQSRS